MRLPYKTSDVARIIGVHPNTVRFYEAMGLLPPAERLPNGYRAFTDFHIDQFRLARSAFVVEILHNGLRRMAVNVIKASAAHAFDEAIRLAEAYSQGLQREIESAQEAIRIARDLLAGEAPDAATQPFKRHEAAAYLGITIDTLRNWEMNGLLQVKRRENGYRVYGAADISRLKVIRALRHAGYSLSSILRLLNRLRENPDEDIQTILDTPGPDDDIILACDKYITSLYSAMENAQAMHDQLGRMKEIY